MKPMKIVCDTNVYLAAAKSSSYARTQVTRSQPHGPYQLYISPEIILEVREKLEYKIGYSAADSADFIKMIMRYARLVYPTRRITGVLQDIDDHIILECAVEARAQAIVTSDKGLLRLKEYEGIAILHPTLLQYLH